MVLISSKKYACETCIKGHRSSACKHTDRPLFEIKKKGRPVTQCEHCRELRKTKQVHVKCICEAKEPLPPPSPTKKKDCCVIPNAGTPTLPAHAAFPHGVPDSTQSTSTPSNNSNSDSEHGGSSSVGCSCKALGSECHCCTPRARPPRRRSEPPPPTVPSLSPVPTNSSRTGTKTHTQNNSLSLSIPTNTSPVLPATPHPSPNPAHPANAHLTSSTNPNAGTIHTARAPPTSHHILARIAELRPVLPRLSARDVALLQAAGGAEQHDLWHHHHPHNPHSPNPPQHHSPHAHGEHGFSPYGRAYEHALMHGAEYDSSSPKNAAGGSGSFYQQDARSKESLLSVASLVSSASHASHPSSTGPTRSQGGRKSQSHSQKSPSFDGAQGFFGVEWRLQPSLSRSTPDAPLNASATAAPSYQHPLASASAPGYGRSISDDAPYGRGHGRHPTTSSSDRNSNGADVDVVPHDNNIPPYTPAPRPRSEAAADAGGGGGFDNVYAARPRSEAAADAYSAGFPNAGDFLGGAAAPRTCGCGPGCACPGCALHGVALAAPSASASHNNNSVSTTSGVATGANAIPQAPSHSLSHPTQGRRHCADPAHCGGACLDCTVLRLPDFGAVVGFASPPASASCAAGNNAPSYSGGGGGNNYGGGGGHYLPGDVDLDLDLEVELDPFEGYRDVGDIDFDLPDIDYAPGRAPLLVGAGGEGSGIGYGYGYGGYGAQGTLGGHGVAEQLQSQSEAIDEWLREVGAGALPLQPFDVDVDGAAEFDHAFDNPMPVPMEFE